jgi:peptidoglycan hydrolase-like protein with peptidoglycan-binding domain
MNYLSKPTAIIVFTAAVLSGCAGAPADGGDSAAKPRAPETTAPPPAPPARPLPPAPVPRQSAPEPNVEGMTVFELQERLMKLGYKPGTVDGVSGPRTVDALKKYQADNKLPVTGTTDADTIRKLRSEKP